MGLAGTPTTVVLSGTSETTTALAPTRAPAPTRTGPRTLAPVPMVAPGPIVGPSHGPRPQPDGDEGQQRHLGADLHDPVDDDLAVGQVHTGLDDHGVADGDLADHHRQAVEDPGDHRNAPGLAGGLGPIAHQRQERVGHERQPDRMEQRLDAGGEPSGRRLGGGRRSWHRRRRLPGSRDAVTARTPELRSGLGVRRRKEGLPPPPGTVSIRGFSGCHVGASCTGADRRARCARYPSPGHGGQL